VVGIWIQDSFSFTKIFFEPFALGLGCQRFGNCLGYLKKKVSAIVQI
jgi:hypothetical protein